MGGSRVVAGAAASCGVLNIQNQESAENDRAAVETLPGHKIRATQSLSQILRFCLIRAYRRGRSRSHHTGVRRN